ncbi:unnamed protein product [Amoebophrya sp. A25]|nr:unnamed protein product [Amoebophrya sp. A25]|eukprot:GSA25T00006396001.1
MSASSCRSKCARPAVLAGCVGTPLVGGFENKQHKTTMEIKPNADFLEVDEPYFSEEVATDASRDVAGGAGAASMPEGAESMLEHTKTLADNSQKEPPQDAASAAVTELKQKLAEFSLQDPMDLQKELESLQEVMRALQTARAAHEAASEKDTLTISNERLTNLEEKLKKLKYQLGLRTSIPEKLSKPHQRNEKEQSLTFVTDAYSCYV